MPKDIKLKGGVTTKDPRLDAIFEKDERSRGFSVSQISPEKPRSYTWAVGPTLDQGQEGACVGFSRCHALAARPRRHPVSESLAREIYHRAQQIDEWPGEEPTYSGTSVLAGVKAAQERGLVESYWWAFSMMEFLQGMTKQPCVAGITWYEGMVTPDSKGMIHATGEVYGRHAILIFHQQLVWDGPTPDYDRSRIGFWNSWGSDWGVKGTAYMTLRDFEKLRNEQAELCFAVDAPTS